jgi:hypothetical protein
MSAFTGTGRWQGLPAHREAPAAPLSWRRPTWATQPLPLIERVFELALLGLMLAYLLFDRAFAWLHIPGTPLFVGEMVMALGLLAMLATRVRLERIASPPLVALLLFMAWGLLRGISGLPTYGFDAARDLALCYYGLTAWFVAMLLFGREGRLWHWLDLYGRVIPWAVLWLGPALLLQDVFDGRPPFVPDSEVSIFAHKVGSIANHATLVLLFLWLFGRHRNQLSPRWRSIITTVVVGVVCMSAIVNRGSFVSVAVGLAVLWLVDRRRVGAMVGRIIAIGVCLLVLGLLFDVRISMFSNDREVSAQQFLANVMSVIDPSGANESLAGTADWRMQYWRRMIADVRQNAPLTGLGFGVNLRVRYGEQDEQPPARDAHNSHVGLYARTGLIGLGLWVLTWWVWFVHILRVRRAAVRHSDADRVNLAGWVLTAAVMMLVNAVFDPTLEGPQVAVWLWAIFGVGAALVARPTAPRRAALDSNGAVDLTRPHAGRQRITS